MPINTFIYKDELYTKIIPSKALFNSNMIHEVTTRGSIFALNINTGVFTILPGFAAIPDGRERTYHLVETQDSKDRRGAAAMAAQVAAREAKEKLATLRKQLTAVQQTLEGM